MHCTQDLISTINKFFENSLNVSETSRQLYIHRNTLVYRLDKLQKSTGLDLRVFEDAITFKIALMVVKYMKYMENHNDIHGLPEKVCFQLNDTHPTVTVPELMRILLDEYGLVPELSEDKEETK